MCTLSCVHVSVDLDLQMKWFINSRADQCTYPCCSSEEQEIITVNQLVMHISWDTHRCMHAPTHSQTHVHKPTAASLQSPAVGRVGTTAVPRLSCYTVHTLLVVDVAEGEYHAPYIWVTHRSKVCICTESINSVRLCGAHTHESYISILHYWG